MIKKKEQNNKKTNGIVAEKPETEEESNKKFEQQWKEKLAAAKAFIKQRSEIYEAATMSYREFRAELLTPEEHERWFNEKYTPPPKKTSKARAADRALDRAFMHYVGQLDDELYLRSSIEEAEKSSKKKNAEEPSRNIVDHKIEGQIKSELETMFAILAEMDEKIKSAKSNKEVQQQLIREKVLKERGMIKKGVSNTFFDFKKFRRLHLESEKRKKFLTEKNVIAKKIAGVTNEKYLIGLRKTPVDFEDKQKVEEREEKYSNEKFRRSFLSLSSLHDAICRGAVSEVKSLIAGGKDVDVRVKDSLRRTPLALAADNHDLNLPNKESRLEIMKCLLQAKANVEAPLADGHTVLYHCISQQCLRSFLLLVEYGARFYSDMRDILFNDDHLEMQAFCYLGEMVNFKSIRDYYLDSIWRRNNMLVLLSLLSYTRDVGGIILSYVQFTAEDFSKLTLLEIKAEAVINIIKTILLKVFEGQEDYQKSILKIKKAKDIDTFLQRGEDLPGFPKQVQKSPELITLQKDWKKNALTDELAKLESHEGWLKKVPIEYVRQLRDSVSSSEEIKKEEERYETSFVKAMDEYDQKAIIAIKKKSVNPWEVELNSKRLDKKVPISPVMNEVMRKNKKSDFYNELRALDRQVPRKYLAEYEDEIEENPISAVMKEFMRKNKKSDFYNELPTFLGRQVPGTFFAESDDDDDDDETEIPSFNPPG